MVAIITSENQQKFQQGSTGFEIISSLFPNLKKIAVAIKVGNELYDLSRKIYCDGDVEVITVNSEIGLDIIRHDAAHVLAQAVKELFGDNVKVAIGPTIKDGFYYDFATQHTFSIIDFPTIEKKMLEIIKRDDKFIREVWSRQQAIDFFESIGENYKVEIISKIPENDNITVYRQGEFIDLCRGPHSPSVRMIKAFKLMKVAGAYWQGDSNKPMLQRIYGTAWRNNDELRAYLKHLEEVERRDHRKIAQAMDLFHIQNEATGQVFWHERGWTLYRTLENYIRKKLNDNGYVEVKTPILVNRELWEKSGHWEKFRENMFISDSDDKVLAIKPMNCPCHVQIFNNSIRSYRDLPMRMAEFGVCHRNEPSGSLHGLMRVRGFTQDDAHIFCTKEQITSETLKFCNLLQEVYKELGFNEITVKFSDRPENRAGSDEVWDKAEKSLKEAVNNAGLSYTLNPGEGAFYGPKLEFVLKDAIEREWQCGTLQMDFVLPVRLNAYYIGQDGQKHHPVMLHRAILGTFERFIGILVENYAGNFPLWLAPVQLSILTVTDMARQYAESLVEKTKEKGIRVEIDLTNEKINYKIRLCSLKKIPILWIIGKNEVENEAVSVRFFGSGEQQTLSIDQAIVQILELC